MTCNHSLFLFFAFVISNCPLNVKVCFSLICDLIRLGVQSESFPNTVLCLQVGDGERTIAKKFPLSVEQSAHTNILKRETRP